MKFRRWLSAVLAAALLAVGSCGYVSALAEEEEISAPEASHEEEVRQLEPEGDSGDDDDEYVRPIRSDDGDDEDGGDEDVREIRQDDPDEAQGSDDAPKADDKQDDPEAVPTVAPEATEAPETQGKGSISISSASAKTAVAGSAVTFNFRGTNLASLSYRITDPNGDTVASGKLKVSARTVKFTPAKSGEYTLVLGGVDLDGNDVSARSSVTVGKPGELVVSVKADSECCHAGDATSFTLSIPAGTELASCSITASQSGKTFFEASKFSETVTVTPPQSKKVTKVTLTLKVKDSFDRTAESSVTIPCYVHDREKRSYWESTMAGVALTGVWPEDLIAIAKSQVGYKESSIDQGEKHGGGISGYTRYGDWAGMPYDEWCAMFASFCLHYAGISEQSFARASNCQRWIERLKKQDLYASRANYTPQLGDLVFFEWGNDNASDHVGIIYKLDTKKDGTVKGITTIEGNSKGGAVTNNDYYAITDSRIVGYGLVNEAYTRMTRDELILAEPEVEEIPEVELPEEEPEEPEPEPLQIKASYGKSAKLPKGSSVRFSRIKPGDEGYDAYVAMVREAVTDEDEALGNVDFVEVSFVDAKGQPVTPKGPVTLTVAFAEKLNASRALRPGVATIGGKKGISINTDVELDRDDRGYVYQFVQEDFGGVICTYVSGKLKYKKDAVEAAYGDVRVKLAYAPKSKVPAGVTLTLRELKPGSKEYKLCAGNVDAAGELRFFEVGLRLNGMPIDPEGSVTLTFNCPEAAGQVRATRVADGQTFETTLSQRINGSTVVKLDVDDLGIFALDFE